MADVFGGPVAEPVKLSDEPRQRLATHSSDILRQFSLVVSLNVDWIETHLQDVSKQAVKGCALSHS